jgi:hypothetical protein
LDLDASQLNDLLSGDGRDPDERSRLVTLMQLLARLPPPPDPLGLYPDYTDHLERFLLAARCDDPDLLEDLFLTLYAHVHGFEAPYTRGERERLDEAGGYWSHAGGLSPILRAGRHLTRASVSTDLGAGNGLQLLLVQVLDPHARSIQVEISGGMIEAGRALQGWLGVPDERVTWIHGDVLEHTPEGADFVYLYRPVRPQGPGRAFYERLARALESSGRTVVVFSIADCLGTFLSPRFEIFYSDGHLTCFRGPTQG